jgi:hypothetical protein
LETPKVKKKQYDPVALQNAYKALQEEGMSVYRASRNYGVPESTLRDRTLGLVSATAKSLNFLFDENTQALCNNLKVDLWKHILL